MTAREFCNLYNYEPYRKLAWAKDCVGVTFTKFDRFGRIVKRRFLHKQLAATAFDISRFVAEYNMENWATRAVDERPNDPVDFATELADIGDFATAENVNRGRVLYTFTVDTAN